VNGSLFMTVAEMLNNFALPQIFIQAVDTGPGNTEGRRYSFYFKDFNNRL
jgi:hypothetical protein